jgi:hypothetical protein
MPVSASLGGLVWKSSQASACWDGTTTTNKVAAPGVYVYVAELRLFDGSIKIEKGDITVVR